jgi:hypothetical protein
MSDKERRVRQEGAWRVYDAICQLGYADCPTAHVEEIVKARKAAYERYDSFTKCRAGQRQPLPKERSK